VIYHQTKPMEEIKLSEISAKSPKSVDKSEAKTKKKYNRNAIRELQTKLFAQKKYSLLVVLQGMDAAGKDGAVRETFKEISPSGICVTSFKKPTEVEMGHDFLWRVHKHVPAKGMISVFNRSHYEDVLIQRVHKWIDMETVHQRYEHINNFEKLLQDNGTIIIKCFLHKSKEEQLIQLNERKTELSKHWKHNPNDYKEREHWDEYMEAYEDVFKYCGPEIPWNIIPSDENWYKEYLLSEIVREKLESLDLEYPPLKE